VKWPSITKGKRQAELPLYQYVGTVLITHGNN